MREPLILRLETVSNFDDRRIDVSDAEAMVIIEEDGTYVISIQSLNQNVVFTDRGYT